MMIPDNLATDDSKKQDEVSNLKPSQVKQRGNLVSFLRNGSPTRKSFEKLMERQSSHRSVTTTTTTASTQPSLGDMLLDHMPDHVTILEEEEEEDLNIKSPPKTPAPFSTDESFLSSKDKKQEATKENSFLDRLDSNEDNDKPEFYADDQDSDEESQDEVIFQYQDNSCDVSGKCSVSDLDSPPSSPKDFVGKNRRIDDFANTSVGNNTSEEEAALEERLQDSYSGFRSRPTTPSERVDENSLSDDSTVSSVGSSTSMEKVQVEETPQAQLEHPLAAKGTIVQENTVDFSTGDLASMDLAPITKAETRSSGSVYSDVTIDNTEVAVVEAPSISADASVPVVTDEEAQRMIDEIDRMVTEADLEAENSDLSNTNNDAEDIIVADTDLQATPALMEPRERPTSPQSTTSDQNIRKLPASPQILSLRNSREAHNIAYKKQEADEEAGVEVAPFIAELKAAVTEEPTACEFSLQRHLPATTTDGMEATVTMEESQHHDGITKEIFPPAVGGFGIAIANADLNADSDDDDDIIFSTPLLEPQEPSTLPISPTSQRNIQGLQFSPVSLQSMFRETLDIYATPHENKETVPPVPELKACSTEDSTVCEFSEVALEDASGNGSDSPDGAAESDPESRVPKKKMVVKDGSSATRFTSLKMILFAFAFSTVVGISIPFFLDTSASSTIDTANPKAVIVAASPTSTPSLSQAPSEAPSSNPSLYPTISKVPTIAPSDHPTVSMVPSMVPSISGAPSLEPSTAPTESMEPSENPSGVPSASPSSNPSGSPSSQPTVSKMPSDSPSSNPSDSPSARPTQNPTFTFQPSRQPSRHPTPPPTRPPTPRPTRRPTPRPTRRPTPRPTRRPTPKPTPPTPRPTRRPTPPPTPRPTPPPVNSGEAFKIRLYWDPAYFWQEEKVERFWCMECVRCAEYGVWDAPDHGCNSYGTGDEGRCRAGDSLWIRDCRGRGNRFNILRVGGGFMVRIAGTNLCIQKIPHSHPHLYIQGCDSGNQYQKFLPWDNNHKFELRSTVSRNDCVSQAHHPKSGELIALHNCNLARRDETVFWEKY